MIRLPRFLVCIVFLLMAQVAFAGTTKPINPKPVPAKLEAVEDALSGPRLVGLYYLDLNYIMRLEKEFGERKDFKALPTSMIDDSALDDGAFDDSILGLLRQSGLKPGESVDYVIGAFSGDDKKVGQVAVAVGQFSVEALTRKWKDHPAIKQTMVRGQTAWLWTHSDTESCKKSPPQMIIVDKQHLIIGDPYAVEWFLKRLTKAKKPEKELSVWRAYRTGKAFAFTVLIPKDLQNVSDNMMAKMFAQSAQQQMPSVTGIYGGGSVTWKPEGLTLELLLESSNAEWNHQINTLFQAWKAQMYQEIKQDFKDVKNLLNYLTLETTDQKLVLQFKINEALVADFEKIADEGVAMFTDTPAASASGAQTQPQEQVIPFAEVNQYAVSVKPGDLDSFDAYASPSESYAAQSGPFGIKVKGISLNPENKEMVDLHVEVVSSPFPNIDFKPFAKMGEDSGAWFRVTHVYDKKGRDVLLDQPCGKDRNSTYTSLNKGFRTVEVKRAKKTATIQKMIKEKPQWSNLTLNVLQGTKVAHLRRGILLSDIDKVEGEIVMQLPSDIIKRRVQAPFKDKVVTADGLRIKLKEGEGQSVAFAASGDVGRILETRALNGSGKYLRDSSKMSSPVFLGQGVNTSQRFHGTPKTVEFVLAQEEEKKTFPFTFVFHRPAQPLSNSMKRITVNTESKNGFMQKRVANSPREVCSRGHLKQRTGAFHFCVSERMDIRSNWQNPGKYVNGSFMVHGPDNGAITHNLSAIQMTIEKVILQDKDSSKRTTFPIKAEQYALLNSSYAPPLQGAQIQIQAGPVDPSAEQLTPVGFEGTLHVRLPRKLDSIRLDLNDLGNTAQATNGLKARFTGIVDNQVELEFEGPRETLVQLQPQDAKRKPLAQGRVTLLPAESGKTNQWKAKIVVMPEARYLAVVYATQQDSLDIPFHLEK